MAFGNGSHSLKRGFLRPNGGSRLPVVLIIALLAGCSLLLYNVYSTTVDRNSLAEELNLLRKKWQTCQKDKTELDTRFESQMKSFKTVKDEVERLQMAERNLSDNQKDLKRCREQTLALQNENTDLKEEQKTDLESCQRKLKAAEEKLEPCAQDKSRLEKENVELRFNLTVALQQTQFAQQTNRQTVEIQHHTNVPVLQGQEQTTSSDTIEPAAPPHRGLLDDMRIPPHRGMPEDLSIPQKTTTKSPLHYMNVTERDGSNQSVMAIGDETEKQDQLQPPLSIRSLGSSVDENSISIANNGSSAGFVFEKQSGTTQASAQGPAAFNVSRPESNASERVAADKTVGRESISLTTGSFGTIAKQETAQLDIESNRSSIATSAQQSLVGEKFVAGPSRINGSLTKRRNQKQRRLNKVIEESAPVDERPRRPTDPDRSRGEQDDNGNPSETAIDRPTLSDVAPKQIGVNDRLNQISDTDQKSVKINAGSSIIGKSYSAQNHPPPDITAKNPDRSSSFDALQFGLKSGKDNGATPPAPLDSARRISHRTFDTGQKDVDMASPFGNAAAVKPNVAAPRKGLKDDYQYKDDENEESEGAAKDGKVEVVKRPVNTRINGGGVADANKALIGDAVDAKQEQPLDDEELGIKKPARFANDDDADNRNLIKI